jgi:undecaprenyl pyrophosphate phosphatase UppP
MQGAEVLIPLTFFGASAFVIVKILEHRQRMRMIDKGVTKVEFSDKRNRSLTSIKYGLVTIALGLAIFMAQMFEEFVRAPFGGEIGLAFVPIFVGVALIISAILEKRAEKEQEHESLEMHSN